MSHTTPIIYNLFPTLAGPLPLWQAHAERAHEMGFNWLYVNPMHAPGFSGSLYAIKDYERLNPALAPGEAGASLDRLAPVFRAIRDLGMGVMVDLVVNHTAKDSPLIAEHPAWFRRDANGQVVSPSVIDPVDTEKVTVWGDLAEVDNAGSPDRDALWRHWEGLVLRLLEVGCTGFRCDAAYKVPAALWRCLVDTAEARRPEVVFVAETLGCRLEEIEALGEAGFGYLYNSSKWWDFVEPWCLEQHEQFRGLAPSIAFPESHDTARLAAETGGSEAVQRQRYAFALAFSAGAQITMGYEFGFRRPLHVVETRPEDWEAPLFDLRPFIRGANDLKRRHPLLAGEGVLRFHSTRAPDVTVIERWSDERGTHRGLILVNRNGSAPREVTLAGAAQPQGARLFRPCVDGATPTILPGAGRVRLAPAEVALIMEAL
ncbi:MAG: alpha-amylase family glycosyl hydrolase [Deltaproteobacteria bacterium]|nr:alpha-amylase family glycosyl hydrolase [Deltaproteobacteria bacterium]